MSQGQAWNAAVQLRMQRGILTRVAAELASALRRVPAPDGSWRSDAQRAYVRRLGELEHDFRDAWAALGEAIDELDHLIAQLERESALGIARAGVAAF